MRNLQSKLLVVALFALSLAGAAGAQSASASVFALSTEKCDGTLWAFCWRSGSEFLELTGEQTVAVVLVAGVHIEFRGTVGGEPIEILCTGIVATVTALQAAPLKTQATLDIKIKFTGCKIDGDATVAARCTIPEERETNALTGTPTSETNITVKPTVGTEFLVIPFSTKEGQSETCPVLGDRAVTGEQELTVPAEPASETIVLKAVEKSKLKLAGNPAELAGEFEATPTGLGNIWALRLA